MEDISVEVTVENLKKNIQIFRFSDESITGDFDFIHYVEDEIFGETIEFSETFTLRKFDTMWLALGFVGQSRVCFSSSPLLSEGVRTIYLYSLMRKKYGETQARIFSKAIKSLLLDLHERGFVTEITSPNEIVVYPVKSQSEFLTSFKLMQKRMSITDTDCKFTILWLEKYGEVQLTSLSGSSLSVEMSNLDLVGNMIRHKYETLKA